MNLQTVFLQLLKVSLSASIVALLVMGIRLIFRKAPRGLICWLWALVALRLLIPALPESKVSVVPETITSGSAVTQAVNYIPEETVRLEAGDPVFMELLEERQIIPARDEDGQSYVLVTKSSYQAPKTLGERWLPILTGIWAAGAVGMLLYLGIAYFRVWKKSRLSVRQEGNIYLCDEMNSPFVFGLFRPRIYLPSDLSGEERECVVGHEKAHIARGDAFRKLGGFLLLSLHWFNPVLWLSYILLCRDIEKACDERVLKKREPAFRRVYSETLLALSAPGAPVTVCPLAFGETGIRSRVKAALRYRKPAFWVVLLLIAATAAAAACTLTDPVKTQEPQEKTMTFPSDGRVHYKTTRFEAIAREGDAAGDGWIFSFLINDFTDTTERTREGVDLTPWYRYSVDNVRHWDAVYGGDPEALERDLQLTRQLIKGKLPEELLAMDPDTVTFEVLDKDQFFRLMRKALTAPPREPEWQRSLDYYYYDFYFRERYFEDGYTFRLACLDCWGFMDVVFFDIAIGTEEDNVLLSDLVNAGIATPEQQEAYDLLREIAKRLEGEEWNFALSSELYQDTVIGPFDFGRLATMVNHLDSDYWNWYRVYTAPEPETEPESATMIEYRKGD